MTLWSALLLTLSFASFLDATTTKDDVRRIIRNLLDLQGKLEDTGATPLGSTETPLGSAGTRRALESGEDGELGPNAQCLTQSVVSNSESIRELQEDGGECGCEDELQALRGEFDFECRPATIRYKGVKVNDATAYNGQAQMIRDDTDNGDAYCDKELSVLTDTANSSICPPKISNYLSVITISFDVTTPSTYTFAINRDHDNGTAWVVDGALGRHDPIGGDASDTHTFDLGFGRHTLAVYGAEGCCDGSRTGNRFKVNGGEFQEISTQALDALCRPGQLQQLRSDFDKELAERDDSLQALMRRVTVLECSRARITYKGVKVTDATVYDNQAQKIIEDTDNGGAYCEKNLPILSNTANSVICPPKISNYLALIHISFFAKEQSTYTFKIARDHDNGTVWVVDDDFLNARYDAQGPSSNGDPHSFDLARGKHSLAIYGAESCCDGSRTDNGFKVGDGEYQDISTDALDVAGGCFEN